MSDYDSSDPKQVRERVKEAKNATDQRREVLLAILGQHQGRDWLFSLLERAGLYHNAFTADSRITAFKLGEQNVGQQLLADIMAADPKFYIMMLEEQGEKDGRSSSSRSDPEPDAGFFSEPGADSSASTH